MIAMAPTGRTKEPQVFVVMDDETVTRHTLEKLSDASIKQMLDNVHPRDIVERVMRGASNTDDKGLMLMHYAVDCFMRHCRLSAEGAAVVVIEKVDRGSNKTFSRYAIRVYVCCMRAACDTLARRS